MQNDILNSRLGSLPLCIPRSEVSPRRPIWNVNRTSEPDLFAKQWAP
jgi:hypothetical protein